MIENIVMVLTLSHFRRVSLIRIYILLRSIKLSRSTYFPIAVNILCIQTCINVHNIMFIYKCHNVYLTLYLAECKVDIV